MIEPISIDRKPYSEPQLIEYGDLEVLTQGSGAVNSDTQQGTSKS